MAEVKATQVFRKEWAEQVKEILHYKKTLPNVGKIPRVATVLLEGKPEAYIPHSFSLGPYHWWKLEEKIAASSSAGDSYYKFQQAYKVPSAAALWENCGKSLDGIFEKIKGMLQEIEDFYDWPISTDGQYRENFALMMAIDSSFLLRFLSTESRLSDVDLLRVSGFETSQSSDVDLLGLSAFEAYIMCDILKLENQIPLFILREALNDAGHQVLYPTFQEFWENKSFKNMYPIKLSPFNQFDITSPQMYLSTYTTFISLLRGTDCLPVNNDRHPPHLLGCVHAFLSPLLQMKVIEGPERTLIQRVKHSLEVTVAAVFTVFGVSYPSKEGRHDLLNAVELKRGGIKVKSFSEMFDRIQFDKYFGTLYLPQITVFEMQTEVFFRNMLAFEFNDGFRGDSFTRYVGLMNRVIGSPEDVRLLRESQIILGRRSLLADKKIAGMWNDMCHPIFTGHLEPPDDLKRSVDEVLRRKYYMCMVKKGAALFVGILFLAINFARTLFAWMEWNDASSRSSQPK